MKPSASSLAAATAAVMATKTPTADASPVDQPIETSDIQKAKLLPEPTGYRILCAVPEVKDTFEGSGIVKADEYMRTEEQTTVALFVLKTGPDAYADEKKFPTGPWCKAGDFVLVRTYAGTRFKIFGKEFRLLNDDQIDAVVADPRGLTRA